ncbi:MAG: hypothetical protein GQ475_06100 [Methylococcaceae bacterium]|nr:hypothetical protein [Methylococcaceae bacterium]
MHKATLLSTIITGVLLTSPIHAEPLGIDYSKNCSYNIIGKRKIAGKDDARVSQVAAGINGRQVIYRRPYSEKTTQKPTQYQRWVPYPKNIDINENDLPSNTETVFQNIGSDLYLNVGTDNNILVLPDTYGFRLSNQGRNGYMNFETPDGLYMLAGFNDNIAAFPRDGSDSQFFKLTEVYCHKKPTAKKYPTSITEGSFPKMKKLNDHQLDTLPAAVTLNEKVISALLINDSRYTSKKAQNDAHPFYFLQSAKQWDSNRPDDLVSLTGRETQSFSVESHRGFSSKQFNEIKTMVGHTFNADLSVEAKGTKGNKDSSHATGTVGLDLGYKYQEQKTDVQSSGSSTDEWRRVKKTLQYNPQGESVDIRTWRLYNVYKLLDSNRKVLRTWRTLVKISLDSYPTLGNQIEKLEANVNQGL